MEIKVTKIIVVNTGGTDNIYFTTNLPSQVWPFEGNAILRMESAQSRTDSFLKENFPDMEYNKIRA